MFIELRKLFTQTQNIFLASLFGAVVIFFVQFAPAIFYVFGAETGTPNDDVQKTFSQYIGSGLRKLSDLPHANAVVVGLIWASMALLVYLLYLFVANVLIAGRNEYVLDTKDGTKSQKQQRLVSGFGKKILYAIIYIVFLVLSLAYLLPYFVSLQHIFVYGGMHASDLGLLFIGLFGVAIVLYLLIAGGQLVWKYEEGF